MQSVPLATASSQPDPSTPSRTPAKVIIRTSPLWDAAFTELSKTERWSLFLKITERKQIQTANTPEQVEQILQGVQRQAEIRRNGRFHLISDCCFKLLGVLKQIKDVGAAVAALNPYASVAWSGVFFLIQAAVSNRDVEQLCWDELPRIVTLISRHQTVEDLYKADHASTQAQKLLRDGLIKLYSGILQYQIEVVIFGGSKMEKFKSIFKDASQSTVKHASETVEKMQRDVIELQGIVDRDVENGHFTELSGIMDNVKATVANLELLSEHSNLGIDKLLEYEAAGYQDKVSDWLSKYLYENSHRKHETKPSDETGKWLLDHPEFQTWFSSRLPAALWLKGFVGTGKSYLAHKVIEHVRVNLNQIPNQRLAFFYCDGTDQKRTEEMKSADQIMRSLLKQLSFQDKTVHKVVVDEYEKLHTRAELTARDCRKLMVEMSVLSQATFIILDGFDECSVDVQRDMATTLRDLMRMAKGTVRLFISGRPSVEPRLEHWIPTTIKVGDHNLDDLSSVIRTKVLSAAEKDSEFESLYWTGGASRAEHVIATIEKHAQGMFRWVQVALGYLHKSKNYNAMTRKLGDLKHLEDLHDIYERIWVNTIDDAGDDRKALEVLIQFAMYGLEGPTHRFIGVSANCEPFRPGLGHVASAAAMASEDDNPPMSMSELVRLCPDFVEYQYKEDKGEDVSELRLLHVSVKEFLQIRHSAEFSPLAGNAFLARLCVQFLLLEHNHLWHKFNDYAGMNWVDHLLKLKELAQGNLQEYLEENDDLGQVVKAFLGSDEANTAFAKWSKWMRSWPSGTSELLLLSHHESPSWAEWQPSRVMSELLR